jgi:hypothetical protein
MGTKELLRALKQCARAARRAQLEALTRSKKERKQLARLGGWSAEECMNLAAWLDHAIEHIEAKDD